MNISFSGFIASIIFSGVGLWFINEGRRRSHHLLLLLGIVMSIYPYFTPSSLATWLVGFALCGVGKFIWDWD